MQLARDLPRRLPASMFVVLHLAPHGPSMLAQILSRTGRLVVTQPHTVEPIQRGRIYVAAPDHHLVIDDGSVLLQRGPRENGHRPAIDPLFRSAARNYGPRVVGVVLSGALDDGTAGLLAVKRAGGVAIVQNPDDALVPSMPRNALSVVKADYVLPASEMGLVLERLVNEPVPEAPVAEADREVAVEPDAAMGKPSGLGCPDCGGALWEVEDGQLIRYRCRVGHAYAPETLSAKQLESL
jgi:two-component system chemotaxis response regulator CheB